MVSTSCRRGGAAAGPGHVPDPQSGRGRPRQPAGRLTAAPLRAAHLCPCMGLRPLQTPARSRPARRLRLPGGDRPATHPAPALGRVLVNAWRSGAAMAAIRAGTEAGTCIDLSAGPGAFLLRNLPDTSSDGAGQLSLHDGRAGPRVRAAFRGRLASQPAPGPVSA